MRADVFGRGDGEALGEGPQGDEARNAPLFPGAPRTRGFLANTEHPYQATFQVTLQLAEGADTVPAMREFHLSPEFKLPEVTEKATAVAGATAAAGLTGER